MNMKPKHPMRNRAKFGDHAACSVCDADIEYHGKKFGWIDRGGNFYCDTSGMASADEKPLPHKKHVPYSDTGR